jgi:hypothetical protein
MFFNAGVCQNLGVKQTAKRNFLGMVGFLLGIILACVFIGANLPNAVRCLVFIPFFFGYLGLFQAHHKVCVVLGLRGQRNMDEGNETVVDSTEKAKLRSRSIKILLYAALLAALCTLVTAAIHLEQVALPF